ncbi:MAG TPA: alpha/beta hydrolase [Bryobacteraceae bacterium]
MPVERSFSINGVDIAVWEWPGADPPVMFCHATGFHSRCWDQVIAHLPGRHCYAVDLRGHGRSTKLPPPYPWRNFGNDVSELALTLNLSGAIGVGHSMGGHSVTLAAALRPLAFSALLLIDPVIRSKGTYAGPWPEAQFAAKRRNRWSSAQEMFDRFKDRSPFQDWDRAVLRDYCEYGLLPEEDHFVLACPPIVEAAIYENSSAPASDIYAEIESIRIPAHVVRAGKQMDPAGFMGRSPTAPELSSSFAYGTDLLLTDQSHFIPMEAPALVAKLIADILPQSSAL